MTTRSEPPLSVSVSVAWFAFTGVSTLNNYTKKVLMAAPRPGSGLLPPRSAAAPAGPPSPPRISHLSPYYEHSGSLPLPRDHSFPPPSLHRRSLPSPSPPPTPTFSVRPPGHEESRRGPEEFYSRSGFYRRFVSANRNLTKHFKTF